MVVNPIRHLDTARLAKSRLVDERCGRYDLAPIVEHYRAGTRVATVHAVGGREMPDDVLPRVSVGLGVAGWCSDELVFIAEIVGRSQRRGDPAPAPGELMHDYATNPATRVTEGLYLMHATALGATAWRCPYVYAEGTHGELSIEWGEVHGPNTPRGPVASLLVDVLTRPPTPASEGWARLCRSGTSGGDRLVGDLIARMFGHGVSVWIT